MKHKWHKEIKAWADGAEIEFRYKDRYLGDEWELVEVLNDFGEEFEYRIKPQFEYQELKAPFNDKFNKIIDDHQKELNELRKKSNEEIMFIKHEIDMKYNKIKEPQYLYVWNVFSKIVLTQNKNGIVIDTWDPSVPPKYIGKIKLEVED